MARLLILILLLVTGDALAKNESDWTAQWCGERGLIYDEPGDGERPDELQLKTWAGRTVYADCMGTGIAVEIDYAKKYRQGLMQATEYALLSGRAPFLLLIVESASDCLYVQDARALAEYARLPMVIATTGHDCPTRAEIES